MNLLGCPYGHISPCGEYHLAQVGRLAELFSPLAMRSPENKKPARLACQSGFPGKTALAAFVERPQAEVQIGAMSNVVAKAVRMQAEILA